jgi:hypothetical protein
MSEHMSGNMPGKMSEDMPHKMPEFMSDKMPEDMSDRLAEHTPVKCQNACQGSKCPGGDGSK